MALSLFMMFTSCPRRRAYHRRRAYRRRHIRLDCRRNRPCWILYYRRSRPCLMSRECCWNEHCYRCSLPTRRQIRRDYPSKRCCRHCDCPRDQHRRRRCRPLDCLHRCCRDCPHQHLPRRDCRHYQRLRGALCCRDFHLAGQRFVARLAGGCLMNHHASCRRICLQLRGHHTEHHLDAPDCAAT